MRLVIIVLLLMVLPTALLSLLAGRSIQARELILERQLRDDAAVRLEAVAVQVDQRLDEALAGVTRMFRETVLAGSDVRRLDESRIMQAVPEQTVRRAYLFMNPMGFIYPEATGAVAIVASRLQPELIRLLAGGGPAEPSRLAISHADCDCLFIPVAGYRDLYAGIEIDQSGMQRFLEGLLDSQSTPVLRLALLAAGDGADLPDAAGDGQEDGGSVVVSDSLGTATSFFLPVVRSRRDAIAVRRLKGMGPVEIGAFVVNGGDMRRSHALQARLVIWGILLLVVMILGSALALITGARWQAQKARRRSEFMAGMSHDLRTPVAAMRMMAESLRAGRVADAARRLEFLEAIVTECDRLGDLIERIMFYFRQEQGMPRYEMRIVAAEAIAATVADRFRRQHPGRVRIEFMCDGPVPPVLADANAVEKALTNLIDNAVKYGQRQDRGGGAGPDDGVDITVRVAVRREGRRTWTVLTVRDHGDGIAAGEQRRIFGRFYRAHAGGHAHRGGFGLGLSMVADIVKAHRGWIRVANASDGGAVFEIGFRGVNVADADAPGKGRA